VVEDSWHAHATALFQAARVENWHLITTNAVVLKTEPDGIPL